MEGLGLNIDAYNSLQTGEGFAGQMESAEAMTDLNKALEAGSITGRETTDLTNASGSPLKYESLDSTLKVVTYRNQQIQLWKRIPKSKAYNTVEEFNQLDSYGEDRGGFNLEGELPAEEDSTYVRRAQLVKFLGVVKSVTHVFTLTNNQLGNAISREAQNGTLWILRKLDRAIHSGNSKIIPQEFNGVYAQHATPDGSTYADGSEISYLDSEIVVDMRGAAMNETTLEDAQEGIIENFGVGTELFAPPKVLSDFVKGFYGQKYINPNTNQVAAGIMGQRVVAHDTQFGRIGMTMDIFMNKKKFITTATPRTASKAPEVPVVGATPLAVVAPTVANSRWEAGDAGDYLYLVTAVNRFGESAPLKLDTTPITVAAGGAAEFQFTAAGSGEAPTGYVIYRGEEGVADSASAKYYKVFEISAAELAAGHNGAAAGKVRDLNWYLPNVDQAFLIENDPEIWTFRQLAPLMKMDLAITAPAYRFMVLHYGTPVLFAPRKMTRIINIGAA